MTSPSDECRDYDPMYKLHGCEIDAGHAGPHRDLTGREWEEHLPDEPGRCDSYLPESSGFRDGRCTHGVGHDGPHRESNGNEWANAPVNPAVAPERRAAFIAGLRDLASYLEANPDLPVQRFGQDITLHTGYELPNDGTWDGELQALNAFARTIGAKVTVSPGGHYTASRTFGPVKYGAVAISPAAWAQHDARNSYADSIVLDDTAPVAA